MKHVRIAHLPAAPRVDHNADRGHCSCRTYEHTSRCAQRMGTLYSGRRTDFMLMARVSAGLPCQGMWSLCIPRNMYAEGNASGQDGSSIAPQSESLDSVRDMKFRSASLTDLDIAGPTLRDSMT